jgi:hypothetical protein
LIGRNNEDAVWMALLATTGQVATSVSFLRKSKWNIERNISIFHMLCSLNAGDG